MLKRVAALAGILLATSAAAADLTPSADAVKELAPTGQLRAAINYGNSVLAQKDPKTGAPVGISAALARELGRRLQRPVDFVPYDEAGAVTAAARTGAWDVAFLAVDPVRAADIGFTAPYVVIEGTYAVPAASPLTAIEDVDHAGVHIGVAKGSAYDLYLTRSLRQAELVRAEDTAAAVTLLEQHRVEALAGVRQPLVRYATQHPDVRVLPGRFMEIGQAMGTLKDRPAGLAYLARFVEAMKASGFVAQALAESGQHDAAVAPPAP